MPRAGLTAAPTLANVLDRLAAKRYPQAPDAVYFETLIDALQQAYSRPARGAGATGSTPGRRELHDPTSPRSTTKAGSPP